MSTFVFVHGAWHGGWSWRFVADLLCRRGHSVHTPSLTGLGDREHLAGPHIGLETHVEDIASLLRSHDLRCVTLVGHSYGGIVVRAVADRLVERVKELFYLDALVPEDGESAASLAGEEIAADWASRPRGANDTLPPSDVSRWGIVGEELHAWATARVSGQPARTLFEPVALSNPQAAALPSTYVHCSGSDGKRRRASYVKRVLALPNVTFFELQAGHDVMITDPDRVVRLLDPRAPLARASDIGTRGPLVL